MIGEQPTQVTAVVNLFDATAGTPPPDIARSSGTDGWYATRLWIMSPGSNSVTVGVKGSRGQGSVIVPVAAVESRRLPFERALAYTLIGVGIVLFAGLVTIAGAAVREGALPPGETPDIGRVRSGRLVMLGAALSLGLLLWGGKHWWDAQDAAFQAQLYRPFSVAASIERADGASLFRLTITDSAWVMRGDSAWLRKHDLAAWTPLVPDHGKLMHLFLIREAGMGAIAHLHPTTDDSVHFTSPLPALPAGRYRVYGDIVHSSGFAKTLVTEIDLPDMGPAKAAPVGDDAIYIGGAKSDIDTLGDGATIRWTRGTTPLNRRPAGRTELRCTRGRRVAGQAGGIPRHAGACGRVAGRRISLHPPAHDGDGLDCLAADVRSAARDDDGATRNACHVDAGGRSAHLPVRVSESWSLSDLGPSEAKWADRNSGLRCRRGLSARGLHQLPFLGTHAGELRVIRQIES